MQDIAQNLKKELPAIRFNESLAPYTTFKVGGDAKYFFEAKDQTKLIKAVVLATELGLRFVIIGGGSNLFFLDSGYDGLVIKNSTDHTTVDGKRIIAQSGVMLHKVVELACKNKLGGIEKLSWIPGTIGGATWGGAGAYGASIWDVIESVKVYNIKEGKMFILNVEECKFGYRDSVFKQNSDLVILETTLLLSPVTAKDIMATCFDIKKTRQGKLPVLPSAGSFFKNVSWDQIDGSPGMKESLETVKDLPEVPTGLLIEKLGLKGFAIGGAQVSKKHANILVNTGGAKADDIIRLASLIKAKVRDKFNIQLENEVQIID